MIMPTPCGSSTPPPPPSNTSVKKHLCLCPICLAKKAKYKLKALLSNNTTPMISWTGDVTLALGATPAVGDSLPITSVTTDNSGGLIVLNTDGTITLNQNGNYMVSMVVSSNPDLTGSASVGLFDSPSGVVPRATATIISTASGLVGVTAPTLMVPAITASTTLGLKVITTTGFGLSATAASQDGFTISIVQIS